MLLAASILTAFFACTPTPLTPQRSDTFAVRVGLVFDQRITSSAVKAAAQAEAAEIWRIYGVELSFADRKKDAALSFEAFVERSPAHGEPNEFHSVLGRAIVDPASAAPAPVRISYDAVDSLLEHRHGANAALRDYVLAAAPGRVLAHEIGHMLLGTPAYHDAEGLMRTTFMSDELARPERSRFRLAERSVARLRARIAALTETPASAGCSKPSR